MPLDKYYSVLSFAELGASFFASHNKESDITTAARPAQLECKNRHLIIFGQAFISFKDERWPLCNFNYNNFSLLYFVNQDIQQTTQLQRSLALNAEKCKCRVNSEFCNSIFIWQSHFFYSPVLSSMIIDHFLCTAIVNFCMHYCNCKLVMEYCK